MALEMKYAAADLTSIGRMLFDNKEESFWDRDTAVLPRPMQKLRWRYRNFATQNLRSCSIDVEADLPNYDPWPLVHAAAKEGFMTEFMPPPFGDFPVFIGMGSMVGSAVLRAEEFCAGCGGLGLLLLAHDLGVAPMIMSGDFRSIFKWQRKIYKEIKAGEKAMASFAITEPGAGSDVEETEGARTARIVTRAKPVDGGYLINGSKSFISNWARARYVTLFSAIGDEGVESWTCFLLDKDMQGLSVGRQEKKLGQKASDASELICEDVFVPTDRIIGKLRGGWALNRSVLNASRLPVAAIGLGIARGAVEATVEFCRANRLANRPLIEYQDVQLSLADMFIDLQVMRSSIWHACRTMISSQALASIAKTFCGDTAFRVCNRAMELMGDHGYLSANVAEKCMRDARLNQIYEGANQINRLAVIEAQWETDILGENSK